MAERDDSFVQQVMSNFPKIHDDDLGFMRTMAMHLQSDGFSVNDAVAYLACTPEVNPYLDEDVALSRMYNIRTKHNNEKLKTLKKQ